MASVSVVSLSPFLFLSPNVRVWRETGRSAAKLRQIGDEQMVVEMRSEEVFSVAS